MKSVSKDELIRKIKILNETIWENRVTVAHIELWLNNFDKGPDESREEEFLHMLFLLAHFTYYGSREMRELLKALFRDLYKYPIIEEIRRNNSDTLDLNTINEIFQTALKETKFLGVGNPSESGSHLLYFFRQENRLAKELFIHAYEIISRKKDHYGNRVDSLQFPNVTRYVFLDDFCGSGHQAVKFFDDVVAELKHLAPSSKTSYCVLFATDVGLAHVRQNAHYDEVRAIFELDDSYKCFSEASRYFLPKPDNIDRSLAYRLCKEYGKYLNPSHPLGYQDGQLLIGFNHNTPDNTLPIFWFEEIDGPRWSAIFRRYPKLG